MDRAATQRSPRVLVATPTTSAKRYILALWLRTLQRLTYANKDILIVDNSDDGGAYAQMIADLGFPVVRSRHMENPYDQLIAARNLIREHAVANGYDYWLSLESDVIPPEDVIERLLAHGKGYVNTVQYNHLILGTKIRSFPALCRRSTVPGARYGRYYELTEEELREAPLITIDRGHLGCTLISADLLRKVVFRHDGWQADDHCLCDDLRELGVTLYCDTTIPIFHVTDGTTHHRQHEWRKAIQIRHDG